MLIKFLKSKEELYKKFFLIFSILIGLAINVYLVQFVVLTNLKAATTPVEITFTPSTAPIPPESTFSLSIDPKFQTISFIRIVLNFNPDIINLTRDIDTSSSPFAGKLIATSAIEANTTGKIEIVLYEEPNQSESSQPFQLATFTFASLSSTNVPATAITVVDEDTQIVGINSEELPFIANYVDVNPDSKMKANSFAAAPQNAAQAGGGNCPSDDYIYTAIGCIPYKNSNALAQFLLAWGIGIGGGIAFILMVFAGYTIMTSSGDPKKLESGKQLFVAALSGLIFLILSVFILRLAGVDILGILT